MLGPSSVNYMEGGFVISGSSKTGSMMRKGTGKARSRQDGTTERDDDVVDSFRDTR